MTDEGLCRVGWSTKDATFNLGTRFFLSCVVVNFAQSSPDKTDVLLHAGLEIVACRANWPKSGHILEMAGEKTNTNQL